eukprot:TRINITY_DN1282_c0_g2_i2.p2 TRINITY_DN1282_c0_g2~~TRINITY_DN1282_c0_g2_i2.p2  ORF type:complete len:156 (+),score=61.04 TRINITY_DN1282_c0_g2_i2:36-470(+)
MAVITEDQFEVRQVDHEAHFDRVSRINATSKTFGFKVTLDINTDIYPVEEGDDLTLALARTLELDGSLTHDSYDPTILTRHTLAERYEYVCHGTVYKVQAGEKGGTVTFYISFGGLLMKLTGQIQKLTNIELNMKVYLLIRHSQ